MVGSQPIGGGGGQWATLEMAGVARGHPGVAGVPPMRWEATLDLVGVDARPPPWRMRSSRATPSQIWEWPSVHPTWGLVCKPLPWVGWLRQATLATFGGGSLATPYFFFFKFLNFIYLYFCFNF